MLKNPNLYLMLLGEAGLFALALLVAFGLRFEFAIPPFFLQQMLKILPVAVLSKLFTFWVSGLYRGMWRYTGIGDLWKISRATIFATLLLFLYIHLTEQARGYPRSIFILDPLLTFLFASGARVLIRSVYELSLKPGSWKALFPKERGKQYPPAPRALIIGADDEGARIAKELSATPTPGLTLVGFVDDLPETQGRNIHGLPVLGTLQDIPPLVRKLGIQEVLVSTKSSGSPRIRQTVKACESIQVAIKELPSVSDITSGRVSLKALRDVAYEDLLGRPEVCLDRQGIEEYLKDKVVLITGAGGSIGSELCRQILPFEPALLVLFDSGEANLYNIEMELRHERGFTRYVPILGQVQDAPLLERVFSQYQPATVFHAAAYKHVPMLEANPWQAISNNILGSQCLMDAAIAHQVQRFVVVSTDKAVRPTNVMGTSKRITELLMRKRQHSGTTFMAVRFGNVLGSSGSVIPLFRRQIEQGGPVTVTHPEITRYFMTIPEAAQLIIQAGTLGQGGEIFVLKMGRPVRIADLARDLIILSGKSTDEIAVIYTGLRPGEKLYEELITADEGVLETGHEQIMVLQPEDSLPCMTVQLKALYAATAEHDATQIRKILQMLVPEYHPNTAPEQNPTSATILSCNKKAR